ncbi:hypothetical protein OsJ_21601 [Oryza sativa Japonica Group]|uniref:Uncharacterized protein n=1 Tax=Oryza sativa subsp. japonica TaxID=39947 RepID=B9FTM7_ORYSJ|nr:hypothetical protein OsJ_21601 [Oryza sativa Japonica Group]
MSMPPPVPQENQSVGKGTAIFSYTCVGLTGVALVAVVVFYCNRHVRRRAPVVAPPGAGGAAGREDDVLRGVADVAAKIPEFAYAGVGEARRRRRVLGVPRRGAGRRGGAAAAGVQAPVPRGVHRHVAGLARHVPALPDGGRAAAGGRRRPTCAGGR